MAQYALRRILSTIPILFAVVTLVFVLLRLVPGGPAYALLGDDASATAIAALNERLGLDRPIWRQYLDFLSDLIEGDLGTSMINGLPVLHQLLGAFPYTASLALGTAFFGLLIGLPIGILTAVYRNSIWDYLGRVLSLTGLSIPAFYLAILLILLFSIQLNWLPLTGGGDLTRPLDFLRHLVLPSLTVGLIMAAFLSRTVRTAMLDVLTTDYIQVARAKGISEFRIILKHAFRNALLPTIAFLGVYIADLLGGTVIIEVVFSRRGWGRILINAMKQQDYPLIQVGLMAFSVIVVFVNLAVDLVYAWVDPKIKYT